MTAVEIPPWPAPAGARKMTVGVLADNYAKLRPKRGMLRIYLPTMDGKPSGLLKGVARGLDRRGGTVSMSRSGSEHTYVFEGGDPRALDNLPCWVWTLAIERAQEAQKKRQPHTSTNRP